MEPGKQLTVSAFRETDLPEAGAIACRLWQGEIPTLPETLAPRLYDYLVRYYFHRESAFNLAARDETGKLAGFLLAALPSPKAGTEAEAWLRSRLQNAEEAGFHREYLAYLESNRLAELQYARKDGELILLLFCSVCRGTGKVLLAELERRCRNAGIISWLLWTDETCDFDYYFRHDFTEERHFLCGAELGGKRFMTYLFRRKLPC